MSYDNEFKLIEEILATELRWANAHLEMDIETISEIMSESYRQVQDDGSVIGKDQVLESYGSGDRFWEIAESTEHDIQIHGNVAIVIAKWRGKGVNAGEKFDYTARFVSCYVIENGKWKLNFDMSTAI